MEMEVEKCILVINATNAISYKVLIEGQLKELTTGDLTYEFTASGTKNYPNNCFGLQCSRAICKYYNFGKRFCDQKNTLVR
jgi:hypothetical protein